MYLLPCKTHFYTSKIAEIELSALEKVEKTIANPLKNLSIQLQTFKKTGFVYNGTCHHFINTFQGLKFNFYGNLKEKYFFGVKNITFQGKTHFSAGKLYILINSNRLWSSKMEKSELSAPEKVEKTIANPLKNLSIQLQTYQNTVKRGYQYRSSKGFKIGRF